MKAGESARDEVLPKCTSVNVRERRVQRECIQAAGELLETRVKEGSYLPEVEVKKKRKRGWFPAVHEKGGGEGRCRVSAVIEHVIEGKLVDDLFVDLMDMMFPSWDPE